MIKKRGRERAPPQKAEPKAKAARSKVLKCKTKKSVVKKAKTARGSGKSGTAAAIKRGNRQTEAEEQNWKTCVVCEDPVNPADKYKHMLNCHSWCGSRKTAAEYAVSDDAELLMTLKDLQKNNLPKFQEIMETLDRKKNHKLSQAQVDGLIKSLKDELTRTQQLKHKEGVTMLTKSQYVKRLCNDEDNMTRKKAKKTYDRDFVKDGAIKYKKDDVWYLGYVEPVKLRGEDVIAASKRIGDQTPSSLQKLSEGFGEGGVLAKFKGFGRGVKRLQAKALGFDAAEDEGDEDSEAYGDDEEEGGEEEDPEEVDNEEDEDDSEEESSDALENAKESDARRSVRRKPAVAQASSPNGKATCHCGKRGHVSPLAIQRSSLHAIDESKLSPSNPAQLFKLKERFKQVVLTKAESFKVGKVTAYDELLERFNVVKKDPRIISLGVEEILATANEKYNAVLKISSEIDHWKASEYDFKRAAADVAMKEFDDAFFNLRQFKESVDMAYDEDKEKKDIMNKRSVQARCRVSTTMQSKNVPAPLANVWAKIVEDHKNTTGSFFANSSGNSDAYAGDFTAAKDWSKPMAFINDSTEYHWLSEWRRSMQEMGAVTDAKFAQAPEVFAAKPKAKVMSSAVENGTWKLSLVDPDMGDGIDFDTPVQAKAYVVLGRLMSFSGKIEAIPYAGVPCVVQATHATSLVTAVDIQLLKDFNRSLETLQEFFEQVDPATIKKMFTVGLAPGAACWIPAGFVPVVTGICSEKGGDKSDAAKEFYQYIVHPILDQNSMKKVNAFVRADVKSWLEKGRVKNLKVFSDGNGMAIDQWVAGWPAAPKKESSDCESPARKS